MKKFLSLVLAMIMTLSLVTISAGATEYKDLTDKDEIQYEEAVAVLNRIGIITGYEDGTFRPETELTRGAAAKIIVSLLIGPDAANALPNASSPYPDVPASHTFAGVISYCKTAGIISGYGDGTFKPANSLTGFAFAKMLLGAIGYKSDVEGFTDTGWTMNVAKIGNMAGLFNRLNFDGSASVNREQACQLALNTLKATMVEYSGGFNVTAGNATVTGAQSRNYVTSNQEYARHIDNRKAADSNNTTNDVYTVEFGEEHFKDLRLSDEHESEIDKFGRPSNVWSYKKVTIGEFAIEPDFTFTTQVISRYKKSVTDAQKVRALGLNGYEYKSDDVIVNGTTIPGTPGRIYRNGLDMGPLTSVADVANWTDNGTLVELYVDEDDADWIRYVVVIQSQLMEVDRVGSDYVALDRVEANTNSDGFNAVNLDTPVNNVEEDDDAYAVVKDLKDGDRVVVIPVSTDHDTPTYDVARAYVPETVKGELTGIERFADAVQETGSQTIKLTVGGTDYPVSNWNKDIKDITRDSLKITYNDVTLTLDEYGNAMLAKDVGETSDYMIVGHYSRGIAGGREVTYVDGWDISGNKVSLNLGNSASGNATDAEEKFKPGDLVRYTNDTNSSTAEWKLEDTGVYNVYQGAQNSNPNFTDSDTVKAISAADQYIKLCKSDTTGSTPNVPGWNGNDSPYADKSIKFIYVTFNDDDEVDSIEIVKGMQNTTYGEIRSYWKSGASNHAVKSLGDGTGNDGQNKALYDFDNASNNRTNQYNAAQACVKLKDGNPYKDGGIKAVVIKSDSSSVGTRNIMYIRSETTSAGKDENGVLNGYTVAMMGDDGTRIQETTIYSYDKREVGQFVRWSKDTDSDRDDVYDLHLINVDHMSTSSVKAYVSGSNNIYGANKEYIKLNQLGSLYPSRSQYEGWGSRSTPTPAIVGTPGSSDADTVDTKNAFFVDMIEKGAIKDAEDMQDLMKPEANGGKNYDNYKVAMVFNDNTANDNFRDVAMIVVLDNPQKAVPEETVDVTVTLNAGVTNVKKGTSTFGTGMTISGLSKNTTYTLDITPAAGANVFTASGTNVTNVSTATGATPTVTFTTGTTNGTLTVNGSVGKSVTLAVEAGGELSYTTPAGETKTLTGGNSVEVSLMTDEVLTFTVEDWPSTAPVATATKIFDEADTTGASDGTITPSGKGKYTVTYAELTASLATGKKDFVYVTFAAQPYTLKVGSLTGYTVEEATRTPVSRAAGDPVNLTVADLGTGVEVFEGDTITLTLKQTTAGAISITSPSVTFASGKEGSDENITLKEDGEAAVALPTSGWTQLTGADAAAKLANFVEKFNDTYDTEDHQTRYHFYGGDDATGTNKQEFTYAGGEPTSLAIGGNTVDYWAVQKDQLLGSITVTFVIGANDCEVTGVAIA